MRFVSVEGKEFIFDRKPLRLRGLGVGSWLNLEHFFSDEDAAYLAGIGANFLRVPVSYHLFWDDQDASPKEDGIAALRRLADICARHHLFFMPDMHSTPGGQNPDWHSECATGRAQFWQYQVFRDIAADIWGRIAAELKDAEYLLGYDLLNEPLLPDSDKTLLNRSYADATAAIRRHDPYHLVLVEGGKFAMDFSDVTLPDPGRSCYTYHFYPGVWDPALNNPLLSSQRRLAGFRIALEQILSTMDDDGPLLCGEAGVELQTLGDTEGVRQLEEMLQVFEEYASSWCLWSYKDIGMMGLMTPNHETPWYKLSRILARDWNHHLDMDRGDALTRHLGEFCFGKLTEEEIYRIQFQIRAILFEYEASHWLHPALASIPDRDAVLLGQSFSFEQCTERTAYRKLLEKACGSPLGQLPQ